MSVDPNDFETKDMRLERFARELREARAELATLRLIVTEKFARDIEVAVRPENAADVAKWAANPGAVRELLRHTPRAGQETEDFACVVCGEEEGRGRGHRRDCTVAAAWRALGDRRGDRDIERAHEEANREQTRRKAALSVPGLANAHHSGGTVRGYDHASWARLSPRPPLPPRCLLQVPFTPGHYRLCALAGEHEGECVPGSAVYTHGPFRLAFESQAAAQARNPVGDFADDVRRRWNEQIELACTRILGHQLTQADRGELEIEHNTSPNPRVTIRRCGVPVVRIDMRLMGDQVVFTETAVD